MSLLQYDESEIQEIEKAYLDEKKKLDQNMPTLAKFVDAAIPLWQECRTEVNVRG